MQAPERDDVTKTGQDGRPVVSRRRGSVVTVVLLVLAAAFVLDGIAGDHGYLANRRDRQRLEQASRELESARRRNAELWERARRLNEQDPAVIEELARRELGFIKPGEKVFIVRNKTKETK